jgi:hypothetical protein
MITNRFLCAAACAVTLPVGACGGSEDGDPSIVPTGNHYGYVVASAKVPVSDTQVREFGQDLGSRTSAELDGRIDNALGTALSTLTALMFDIQGTIDDSVDQGSLLLLIDFQTADFNNHDAAGFRIKFGANPTPPACNGSGDTTCRQHLSGTGQFTVAADSPADALVAGKIANGTFTGGPGNMTLQIAIGSTTPIKMDLLRARVTATGISETGIMSANVGGLLLQTDLMTEVGPAIQDEVTSIIERDCTGTGTSCGCTGTGLAVITALDTMPADCMVSVTELLEFPLVKQVLQPDSCSQDSCSTADALSFGVRVTAVKGTFPL